MAVDIIQANDGYGPYCEIELTNDSTQVALVSPIDYDYISQWNWQVGRGYAMRSQWRPGHSTSESIKMYIAVAKRSGLWKEGFLIDHKNRVKLDCRRDNLRLATKSQNAANTEYSSGLSQYKGVSYYEGWRSHIKVDYVANYLGMFDTEVNAAIAYDLSALERFGEFACTNFPKENYEGMTYKQFMKDYKSKRFLSGYKGVTKDKRDISGRWVSNTEKMGRRVYVGSYETDYLASRGYDLCRIWEFNDWEKLNHPIEDYPNGLFEGMDFKEFKLAFGKAPRASKKNVA